MCYAPKGFLIVDIINDPINKIIHKNIKKSDNNPKYFKNIDTIININDVAIKLSELLNEDVKNNVPNPIIINIEIPSNPDVNPSAATKSCGINVKFVGLSNIILYRCPPPECN